jgi:hypothetical protein
LLELHDRIVAKYHADRPLSYVHNANELVTDAGIGVCYGLDVSESAAAPEGGKYKLVGGDWELSRKWVLLRYMPRNNFLAKRDPLPICQGRNWDWSGYVIWQGPEMPAGQWQYGKFTGRRADVDWTLNTVRVDVGTGAREGELTVRFSTVTPYLETFLVRVDGGAWRESAAEFEWRLHGGGNRLEVRVRNTSGVEGRVTGVEVGCA